MLGTINNIKSILKNSPVNQWELVWNYLRISCKYLLLHRILRLNIRKEKLFGKTLQFNSYPAFLFIFEEIFIQQQYRFRNPAEDITIIDCGSNIGLSILFFKIYFPQAKIKGFEPDRNTFEILKKNVDQNNLKDVQLINAAVYNQPGNISFHTVGTNTGTLVMSTRKERLENIVTISVKSVLLSEFISYPVHFLKLDIEGAETLVLQELADSGKLTFIHEMCIEYHHHLAPLEDNLSDILRILETNNFGYNIDCRGLAIFNKRGISQDILIRTYNKKIYEP